jgi:thymidine phosphorylase
MNFLALIESKREGRTLAPKQIQEIIREFTIGKIPDAHGHLFSRLDHR